MRREFGTAYLPQESKRLQARSGVFATHIPTLADKGPVEQADDISVFSYHVTAETRTCMLESSSGPDSSWDWVCGDLGMESWAAQTSRVQVRACKVSILNRAVMGSGRYLKLVLEHLEPSGKEQEQRLQRCLTSTLLPSPTQVWPQRPQKHKDPTLQIYRL